MPRDHRHRRRHTILRPLSRPRPGIGTSPGIRCRPYTQRSQRAAGDHHQQLAASPAQADHGQDPGWGTAHRTPPRARGTPDAGTDPTAGLATSIGGVARNSVTNPSRSRHQNVAPRSQMQPPTRTPPPDRYTAAHAPHGSLAFVELTGTLAHSLAVGRTIVDGLVRYTRSGGVSTATTQRTPPSAKQPHRESSVVTLWMASGRAGSERSRASHHREVDGSQHPPRRRSVVIRQDERATNAPACTTRRARPAPPPGQPQTASNWPGSLDTFMAPADRTGPTLTRGTSTTRVIRCPAHDEPPSRRCTAAAARPMPTQRPPEQHAHAQPTRASSPARHRRRISPNRSRHAVLSHNHFDAPSLPHVRKGAYGAS